MAQNSDITRLLTNMVRIGTVTEVDGARARVRFGGNHSNWLPWCVARAGDDRDWQAPSIGEQVLLLSPSGDPAQAVIAGSLYQALHPAPSSDPNIRTIHFVDGTTITYDKEATNLDLSLAGSGTVNITAAGGVTVNASGGVTINANDGMTINAASGGVTIDGDLSVSGDITDHTSSMQDMRDIYDSHGHSPSASSPPTAKMGG